jgi:NAD(P)H-nitrite reductase large subunit
MEWIKAGDFDTVILATGAKPVIPRIPGDGSLEMLGAMDVAAWQIVGR